MNSFIGWVGGKKLSLLQTGWCQCGILSKMEVNFVLKLGTGRCIMFYRTYVLYPVENRTEVRVYE